MMYYYLIILLALFGNKRFMLDEMTWRNASKFAINYIYKKTIVAFSIFHFVFFGKNNVA